MALAVEDADEIAFAQAQDFAGMAALCFIQDEVVRVPAVRGNIKAVQGHVEAGLFRVVKRR